MIGLRIGPFEIVEEASVPEIGHWFLADRAGITRKQPAKALIRVLDPDAPAEARTALQQQFDNLRAVADERIPEPIAYYEGTGALAMAAVSGTPLSLLLEGRRADTLALSPATLLDLLLELSETLRHAHARGRCHGHLGPHNVWLSTDGKLWIFGFGPGPQTLPPTGWLAPERAREAPVSAATDQWSLGALALALVTGHTPWEGDDATALARSGDLSARIATVAEQWPALGRLIERLVASQPAHRFPDIDAARKELLALSRKAPGTSDRRVLGGLMARGSAPSASEVELGSGPPPAPLPRRPDTDPGEPASAQAAGLDRSAQLTEMVPERLVTEVADDRLATEVANDRLATEVADDRLATEVADDRLATDALDAPPSPMGSALAVAHLGPVPTEPPDTEERVSQAIVTASQQAEPAEGDTAADTLLPFSDPDVEPSEATVLFDASAVAAALAEMDLMGAPPASRPDLEPSDATVLFSSEALQEELERHGLLLDDVAGPTMVPPSDGGASDGGEDTVAPRVTAPAPTSEEDERATAPGAPIRLSPEPEQVLPEGPLPEPLPDMPQSAIQRVAPVVVVLALLAMLALLLRWML